MACGEGYGSEVLSRGAASVLGVEANPEAFEHARLRYPRQNLRFERGLVETHGEAGELRRRRVPADDRARPGPGGGAAPLRAAAGARRRRLRLDPEPADDRARPAPRSPSNPWHIKEYRAHEFDALCRTVFGDVELLGLFHARRLRAHDAGVAPRLGRRPPAAASDQAVLRPLHAGDRAADFALAALRARPRAGLPGGLPVAAAPRLKPAAEPEWFRAILGWGRLKFPRCARSVASRAAGSVRARVVSLDHPFGGCMTKSRRITIEVVYEYDDIVSTAYDARNLQGRARLRVARGSARRVASRASHRDVDRHRSDDRGSHRRAGRALQRIGVPGASPRPGRGRRQLMPAETEPGPRSP